MLESGLRVTQLLPSIVIGDSRTGTNNGDTKVVNAPVNAFGRLQQALDGLHSSGWRDRLRARLIGAVASAFPADRSAALNLVPVDRVVAGVLAALTSAQAVGTRIHLASDRRIRSGEMTKILREELGIKVRRTDPTLTRKLMLPLMGGLLEALGERKLGRTLERLGAVLGVYSEWGQPIHGVGNDVGILGLPTRRPDSFQVFRMVCRHNRYVLRLGSLKDPDEIARRERLWERAIDDIEFHTGRSVAALPHAQFLRLMQQRLDLDRFDPRASA
jgi:hypothetical protein